MGDEPAMVIDGADEIKIADEGKMGFAHDIDLPKSVGSWRLEPLHPFDRRQGDSAEMMTRQDPPNRFPMDVKLEMTLDEPS
jgi:hypothetical protein